MQSCAEVFSQFGGHAGAAGFSMDPQRISELHRSIDQAVLAMGPLDDFVLQIDGTIAISGLSLDLVDDLERLAPFGAGNPPLVLMCPHLRLVKSSPVGKDGEHFSVLVEDEAGNSQQVIWWHGGNRQLPQDWFDLALTARSTTFQGKRALQVEWIDFRPVELDQASPVARYRPEIIDYRDQAYPFPLLEKILAETHSQVWAEGEAMSRLVAQGIPAVGRTGLVPGRSLVIWTAPASPGILAEVILGIKPEYIYLFALPPETERLSEFTRLLAGLVKYKMNHQNGVISIPDFAIRMAQLEITILKGIHLLEAMGHLEVVESKPGELVLRPGGREDQGREKNLSGELDGLLKEAKSYRAYLSRINIQTLIDSLVPG
jgi:single-stranded-DNA-specific exonuclease